MQKVVNNSINALKGEIEIPSDKSISHRAIILSSLARGKSVIKNFSDGKDPYSTLNLLRLLGVDIEKIDNTVTVCSTGSLTPYNDVLDCGNSGTTMRLLSGILARQDFYSVLTGDESLVKRPMKRIIEPLEMMGAKIESSDYKAPLKIYPQELSSVNYQSKLASAQVKSCVLLAGLGVDGITSFTEPYVSRNHTEIMLRAMGANIKTNNTTVSITKSELTPVNIEICGDISSAAYFIVAALIVPNSKVILKNVGLNSTRTGIIDVVKKMGGNIEISDMREICGEPVGDITVQYSENLAGCDISSELIPKLIDEIPVIAVLATQAGGQTVIKDAQDLRNKESDRITTIVRELKKLGADIEETVDGMIINGKTTLIGDVQAESYNDHRLAMSLYVAGLVCKKEISVNGFEWVNISFPTFEELMSRLVRMN